MMKQIARAALEPALAVLLAMVISIVFVLLAGGNPAEAGLSLWTGAFGDFYAWCDTLVRTTPLLVAGLAVAFAFRAGALNIGAEGQLLGGAIAATLAGLAAGSLPAVVAIPLVLLSSAAGGAASAAVAAWLRRAREVPEVLSTILLNFIILQITAWLVRGPLQESARSNPQSDPVAASAMLPRLAGGTSLTIGLPIALVLAAVLYIHIFKTAGGLELRTVGASPMAALFAGFKPGAIFTKAMLGSGALAGLAGGIVLTSSSGRLLTNISNGAGYTAIAVAMLGGLHPLWIAAAALFFGAMEAGAVEMQRSAGVSAALARVAGAATLLGLFMIRHLLRRFNEAAP